MRNMLYVLPKGKFVGSCQTVLDKNGKSLYGNETKEWYIKNGFKVVDREEFDNIFKEYLNSLCGNWEEITEDEYNESLNVLPPRKYENYGFYIGEPYMFNLYGFYQKYNGKYYYSIQPINKDRFEIISSLKEYIYNKRAKI